MQRFALVLDNGSGTDQVIGYVRARSVSHAWQRFYRIAKLGELSYFFDNGCDINVQRANAHDV